MMMSMGVDVVYDRADYRLLIAPSEACTPSSTGVRSVPARDCLVTGLQQQGLLRFAASGSAESKYPLRKMLAFAIDRITSFSVTP